MWSHEVDEVGTSGSPPKARENHKSSTPTRPSAFGTLCVEDVHQKLIPLRAAAKGLGVTLAEPFLQVAFLPLPVIPHLKITDKGLVDVDRFELVRD